MTAIDELEGRELDKAVAEAMGWKRRVFQGQDPSSLWDDEALFYASVNAGLTYIDKNGNLVHVPLFSFISGFHFVKREIKNRGWDYGHCYSQDDTKRQCPHHFYVQCRNYNEYSVYAETEEIAGCRAFLKAVEGETPKCPHEHTVLNTSGGMHFSDGEVWDDIETEELCLDCGEVVEPENTSTDPDVEFPF